MDSEDFGPFRVPLELADGVTAEVVILLGDDGEMTVSQVTVTAPDGGSVTGEHLRTMSLPSAYTQAREAAATLTKFFADYPDRPTTGRWSGISDDEMARYAAAYLLALRKSPNAPVRVMMETGLGSEAKIRDRLKACRTYGWLIGARQGHAGAVAGPRLVDYRKADEAEHGIGQEVVLPDRKSEGVREPTQEEAAKLMAGLRSVEQVRQDHAHEGVELDEQLRASADADKEN